MYLATCVIAHSNLDVREGIRRYRTCLMHASSSRVIDRIFCSASASGSGETFLISHIADDAKWTAAELDRHERSTLNSGHVVGIPYSRNIATRQPRHSPLYHWCTAADILERNRRIARNIEGLKRSSRTVPCGLSECAFCFGLPRAR